MEMVRVDCLLELPANNLWDLREVLQVLANLAELLYVVLVTLADVAYLARYSTSPFESANAR